MSHYRISIYAGVHKIASKVVKIDPEDYENDQAFIDAQLEELAEEFKSEWIDAEWALLD